MKAKPGQTPHGVVLELGPHDENLLQTTAPAPFHIRKILVPVDFSDASRKALIYATRFAEAFGASLEVLHVLELPYGAYGASEAGVFIADETTLKALETSARKQAEDLLRRTRTDKSPSGEIKTKSGVPFREIVQHAKDGGHDLIIISTHGNTGLKRLFIGSTAERVVRHAPCPVLVVREHEVDFLE